MHGVIPYKAGAQRLAQRLPRVGRRTALLAAAALIGAAAAWYGWSWWTAGRFIQSTDDAYLMIGARFVLAFFMVPLLRKVAAPQGPSADAHQHSQRLTASHDA
ncbi:MAG: hypothetical protein K2Z80_15345 [Xanthobacteraceae bacterium]|nr:hypothetical protein [Xanthobacteraceae bacterium]